VAKWNGLIVRLLRSGQRGAQSDAPALQVRAAAMSEMRRVFNQVAGRDDS
jgi:hypothetical protein